jgi:hypothetical protein
MRATARCTPGPPCRPLHPTPRGLAIRDGLIIFGLSTATGVGLYTYDHSTRQASDGPAVSTVGDLTRLVAF